MSYLMWFIILLRGIWETLKESVTLNFWKWHLCKIRLDDYFLAMIIIFLPYGRGNTTFYLHMALCVSCVTMWFKGVLNFMHVIMRQVLFFNFFSAVQHARALASYCCRNNTQVHEVYWTNRLLCTVVEWRVAKLNFTILPTVWCHRYAKRQSANHWKTKIFNTDQI